MKQLLTWFSFQSYNHLDRCIRHYAYQLRLDTITTVDAVAAGEPQPGSDHRFVDRWPGDRGT